MFFRKLKTPYENYIQQIALFRYICNICGLDLLDVNFRFSWRTKVIITGIVVYFMLVFLTVYNHFKDDWTIVLRAPVTLGSAIQGAFKLLTFLLNHDSIIYITQLVDKSYEKYQKMGRKYCDALNASNMKTKKAFSTMAILYGIGYTGMIVVPFALYAITGNRNLIIEFHIPFLDVNTYFGYFATLIIQTILIAAFGTSLFCGDVGAMLFLAQAFMFSQIFKAKIECLNGTLEDEESRNNKKINEAIKDIIQWHQLYGDYTATCNSLFYYVITVQIMTAFTSTVLCIYLTIAGGWPSSYLYTLVAFSSLHLYCIMGTQNEIANEDFVHYIYNLNWYNLNASQQKLILQILCKAQKAETIDIAGIMPLSVSTGLQLTKTIYTISMMMINFFLE